MNLLRLLLFTAVLTCLATVAAEQGVKITPQPDRVRVEINGQLFTEYYFTNAPRPYCYPLIGPENTPMTRNYPMQSPAGEEHDHPHHRSFWYAHGEVNGQDFWDDRKNNHIVHQKFSRLESGKNAGVIESENKWITSDGKWICSDKRKLTFHSDTNPKVIDFEIILKADHGDLVFGDTKEGTMAIRVAESMRLSHGKDSKAPAGSIVQSTGVTGNTTWGKRADWCDYNGLVDGKHVGIAIFDNPKNPRHPTWWHVRDYGLFAANPFGAHYFEGKPAGTGDFKIAAGKTATFRYRIVLHEGDERTAHLAELYQTYSSQK